MAGNTRRRAGQVGQIEFQGRSHATADCGTYRLVARTGPNLWTVEWTAPCDTADDDRDGTPHTSTLRFVTRAEYAKYF